VESAVGLSLGAAALCIEAHRDRRLTVSMSREHILNGIIKDILT
jgi:hypothetical protein